MPAFQSALSSHGLQDFCATKIMSYSKRQLAQEEVLLLYRYYNYKLHNQLSDLVADQKHD